MVTPLDFDKFDFLYIAVGDYTAPLIPYPMQSLVPPRNSSSRACHREKSHKTQHSLRFIPRFRQILSYYASFTTKHLVNSRKVRIFAPEQQTTYEL